MPHLARGFCSKHYNRARSEGAIECFAPAKVNAGGCKINGCKKPCYGRGMCSAHYNKWKKYGDPLASAVKRTGMPCKIDGCSKPTIAKGMCSAHYAKWKKHSDPLFQSGWYRKRFEKIVDGSGYVLIFNPSHPHATRGGRVPEHRLVMCEAIGRALLPGENVHHRNGNKQDNRLKNLELWVTTQPAGQRPKELVAWAKQILKLYNKPIFRKV